MIITIGGIKGGTGKTTIATNLAVWLSKKGSGDVLLVDADEQETSTDFTSWRENNPTVQPGFTSVKLTGENIRSQLQKLKMKYEFIVVDSGGRDTNSQRSALMTSDVFLVPFKPRSLDFWTLRKVQHVLAEVRSVKPDTLHAIAFLNQADFRGGDNQAAGEAISQQEDIYFLDSPVMNRKAFANAAGQGLAVSELLPQDKKATQEIDHLFTAILERVQSGSAVQTVTV
jgi:chromosome partitioning protein